MTSKFLTGSLDYGDKRGVICGTVSSTSELSGVISSDSGVSGTVYIEGGREKYTGEYIVIPKSKEQILETANKIMMKDVTVKEIPYAEVSNPAGGVTVIIG